MNTPLKISNMTNHPFNWYKCELSDVHHAHPRHYDLDGDNRKSLCGTEWRGSNWDTAYLGSDVFTLPHCEECARVGLMMELAE